MPHLEAFALKATGSTKTLIAPASAVGLTSATASTARHVGLTGPKPEERTTWIHVSPEGEWDGHPSGAFKLATSDFVSCIAAARACETPAPVDYDHASLRPLDGQPTPAAGYILDLEVRADGLWALVELTQRAAEMVRSGEYRFCSGVFVWDAADRATGEPIHCQLDSIGLTNKPFIDGQHAIRLSRRALSNGASMEISKKDLMEKLDALVSGSTVTAAEIKALVEFLEKSSEPEAPEPGAELEIAEMAKDAKPGGEKKPEGEKSGDKGAKPMSVEPAPEAVALAAPPAQAAPMAEAPALEAPAAEPITQAAESQDAAAMLLMKIAEMTGLDTASIVASLDANGEQIKAAFLGADGGALPMAALTAKLEAQDATISALSAEVAKHREAEAKRADEALVAEVETHVAAGRILPGTRETWISLARKAPGEFRALAAKLPGAVPMGRDTPADAPVTSPNGGEVAPDRSHPRFAVLHKQYSDPASPYARLFPKSGPDREKAIEAAVINHLRREQPVSG